MFTGIVETLGKITKTQAIDTNIIFTIQANIASELKVDQSVSHNGVCLTVIKIYGNEYEVAAVHETLAKTNLKNIQIGEYVNLERAMSLGGRIDGHLVQGHIDTVAWCREVKDMNGSYIYYFDYQPDTNYMTVPKGSVCVNGVSLTVVDSTAHSFSVAIIPYTYENTTFKHLKVSDLVNIEFDILGKYVVAYMHKFNMK
ncbi:MAG: riboflavin synthase [Cytophagales bacterium]|nr:riboflavin synthase [Cytophagales bacterium]